MKTYVVKRVIGRQWTVSLSDYRWDRRAKRGSFALSRHDTQQQAIEHAKALALEHRCRVVWYDADGKRQGGTSYAPRY